jgi:ubiquinone/menaquinone biosynthesis C-methylase UbiE
VRISEPIRVDRRDKIVSRSFSLRELRGLAELGISRAKEGIGFGSGSTREVETVEFANSNGQSMRGIVNSWGAPAGSTAVVIPPAWGRTKETLMPLALTIVETFKRAGEPIQVLRYDGTNRRGESYIDADCRSPGSEYLHFRFSQAASDVSSAIDYLHSDASSAPSKVILVTFSLAAIEGRCAMAREGSRTDGWVAVVGVADLQSALRTISGGIDYGYGLLRGLRFGRHELVGVVADMDLTGLDAIAHEIGFLEDARRDMSQISAPVTWIHGQYDAWMDLDRVAEVMSCGDTRNRKLIEGPTGHQLRSSRAALSTFRLVAEEISEMALARRIRGATPSAALISQTRRAEKTRLPDAAVDLRSFWEDYLLGRDRTLGIELLTATAAYRNFLNSQVELLNLGSSDTIIDVGAGMGELALATCERLDTEDVSVIEIDFVGAALRRGAQRRNNVRTGCRVSVEQCIANLDLTSGRAIPFRTGGADAVLASLVISYIANSGRLLEEAFRVLRPGGRIVVSSMLEDADVSMLFHDGLVEFATTEARQQLVSGDVQHFDEMVRNFLNDASKLLDLEEQGAFRFWSAEDLSHAVANAGFVRITTLEGLGNPPQGVIVGATRP